MAGVLALAGIMTSLQQTMILPVLPAFEEPFDATPAETSWLVTATLLTAAVATPLCGRLADIYGKRPLLLVCIAAIAAGSTIGALAPTLGVVVAGRALIGAGMAVVPIGISTLRDELPPERIPMGVALMSASFGVGSGVGFPLGGILATSVSWRVIFALTTVLALVVLVAVALVVRRRPARGEGGFDVVGAGLLSVAMVAVLMGLTGSVPSGVPGGALTCFLVFAVMFVAWVLWEVRAIDPLVDLRLALHRPVALTNIATATFSFGIFTNVLGSAMQVQAPGTESGGFGLDEAGAGLFLVPSAVAFLAMAPVSAWLLGWVGGRWVLALGGGVMATAFALRIIWNAELWHAVLFSTVIAVGTAFVLAAAPWLLFRNVPLEQTASATSVNALVRSVGTAVSSATAAGVVALALPAAWSAVSPFDLLFAVAAAACGTGCLLSLGIPRGTTAGSAPTYPEGAP
ncbi:MFS transporter [Microbacterium sp. E-13]|uniref:MFS transporter n=1 Tax=Microbacterium sp. E-13 TaxID=3404048 RepID=UPI003CF2E6F7